MASDLIAESARRLFAQHGGLRVAGPGWPAALWQAIEEAGFALALLPEEDGGFGLTPEEAVEPLRIAASVAAPVPLAETMLANWLLARAGLPLAEGPAAVAFGAAKGVPFGRHLALLVLCEGTGEGCRISSLPVAGGDWRHGTSIAGEPRDDLDTLPQATGTAHLGLNPQVPRAIAAALRAQQIAGAVQAVLEMTTRYAGERVQFGRALGKFQAIQQYLAVMAGETAAAGAAAQMAALALPLAGLHPERLILLAAAAKIRTGEAAGKAADLAHQIHGAIGFSQDYPLHRLTRRLWSWRDDDGREAEWSAMLGAALTKGGPLWPQITALQSDRF